LTVFLIVIDDWYTVRGYSLGRPATIGTSKTVKNSQKTVKTAKMTIGVPIVTYTDSAEHTKSACEPALQAPPRCIPNVTAHPSTASVPISVLLYNGPLLCGFNVPIKGVFAPPQSGAIRDGDVLSVRLFVRLSVA